MGSLPLNVVRMVLSLTLLAITLWLTVGTPYPMWADGKTWLWLSLSGLVGYALGDWCLFQSYILMGSRFGQLFMTLASPSAALTAWILLGESMQPLAIAGMVITLGGISLSVLNRGGEKRRIGLKLPPRGILLGIGAGMCQGIGLVLSKLGMEHYETALATQGIDDLAAWTSPTALIPLPLSFMMPFASTMIRAITGLAGFCVALFLLSRNGKKRLQAAVTNRQGMYCALGAAIFSPFIGVSLSLMATLYTHAGIAQTIMSLTPVLIILPSWMLFRQRVTVWEVVGAFICVLGVTLFFV